MRGTEPAPMVPMMPIKNDETPTRDEDLRADGGGGERAEPFGAPLVPDCS